ncbi:hypothetical protein ABIA31_008019 [Catenulispora sp. MAP5-51]|uniref:hypothetical protein n=1 Tax=Catenulispora sp. MAP5-51 TaxID=3156298 RepID=UPI003514A325
MNTVSNNPVDPARAVEPAPWQSSVGDRFFAGSLHGIRAAGGDGAAAEWSPAAGSVEYGAEIVLVPVADLCDADSPRTAGLDPVHLRALAEIEAPLPPIVVHRGPPMRVVDGMHRLTVARTKGQELIAVQFFDGSREDAFRLGVSSNVAHGLPLSAEDRRTAAARIMGSHPRLSDRAIARTTGLAARTVADIRAGLQTGTAGRERLGADGRVRPLSGVQGRLAAAEIIARRPQASLREIAREAGISVGTARDVRLRLQAGEPPVPERRHTAPADVPGVDVSAALKGLRHDPTLRYSQSGRALIRWFDTRVVVQGQADQAVRAVPPHWRPTLAAVARECAKAWLSVADEFEGSG